MQTVSDIKKRLSGASICSTLSFTNRVSSDTAENYTVSQMFMQEVYCYLLANSHRHHIPSSLGWT